MLQNNISKESSLSSSKTNSEKTDSVTYNTFDYLNPNSVVKEDKGDLLKLLGQGPLNGPKKNSIFGENMNFDPKQAYISNLNVDNYQNNMIENQGKIL